MESRLYQTLASGIVQCRTCSHFCRIENKARGRCGVRENKNGKLYFLAYDKVIAASVDPIEKKPIFHLQPGSLSYSIATPGCNFSCDFCQNSDIAQMPRERGGLIQGRDMGPAQLVAEALAAGCRSLSYTYTEPTVFFELALDTARLARQKGLYNIFVTNGYMSPEALDLLSEVLDAANVDLKSFDPGFYEKYCQARLEPVKQNLKAMKERGILLEITTLLIPGLNNDAVLLDDMARFIANELGPETPWHISRFHPSFRMTDRGATSRADLEAALKAGQKAGLHHVYIGNLPGHPSETTFCHECGTVLVERSGYRAAALLDPEGRCPGCGIRAHGLFNVKG